MKITKVTVTLEDGTEMILPLQQETVLQMYQGLKELPKSRGDAGISDGWAEFAPNGINPFVLYSAPQPIVEKITQRIDFIKVAINT